MDPKDEVSSSTPVTESDDRKTSRLWGGRFDGKTDPVMEKFNASIGFDKVLWKQDIEGSVAYADALADANLLTLEEKDKIQSAFQLIEKEWQESKFVILPFDEDIHTANERRLKELIGPVGGKIHTGRSRNDQVALDMRLWMRQQLQDVSHLVMELIQVLVDRAKNEQHILLPGYTHLQRAQPIRWAHFLLSHAWALKPDLERLQGIYKRTNVCPLGSGALAGTPFPIDREALARNLGFDGVTGNSLLAVGDRDFIVEYLFWVSLTSAHLSQLAEDLIIYSTSEFGFVKISDAYSTGSSIMPQKKNPDSLELIRGKSGRLMGKLSGFLIVIKGLPSTYNKDLQEDKEVVFGAAATIKDLLQVASGTVATLTVDESACRLALTEDMLATDVAYYLVRKGMPFREAHEKAGKVVKLAEELQCGFSQLQLQQLQAISPLFMKDISDIWNFEHSVEQYTAVGGTALQSVVKQIEYVQEFIKNFSVISA